MGSAGYFCTQSPQCRACKDFPTAIFWQIPVGITTTTKQRGNSRACKSALGEVPLVMGALAALSPDRPAIMIVIVITMIVVVSSRSMVVASQGIIAFSIAPMVSDLSAVMVILVIILVNIPLSSDHFAIFLSVVKNHHTRGLARHDYGSWRRLLQKDSLRLGRLLTDDDWCGRRRLGEIVLRLLSISFYVVAMAMVMTVVEALLGPRFHSHLFSGTSVAGAPFPLPVRFLGLIHGDAGPVHVSAMVNGW